MTRYGREGASSRVRFLQYVPALASAGLQVEHAPLWDERYLRGFYAGRPPEPAYVAERFARRLRDVLRARTFDAVWLEAEALPKVPYGLEELLRVPFVVDYDDAVFHVRARGFTRGKIERVMRAAHTVVAGNEYVATHARASGARRVEVVPTVVDTARYVIREPSSDAPLRVGWIGTPHTARSLAIISGALARAAREVPLLLVVIGASADDLTRADVDLAGIAVEHVAWHEDDEADSLARVHVGIMPLADEPFERGKSGYKLVQCMAAARPVIASPVGANLEIVTPDVGVLAGDDAAWVSALTALANDPARRARMGTRARARVESRYSLAVAAPRMAQIMRRTAE